MEQSQSQIGILKPPFRKRKGVWSKCCEVVFSLMACDSKNPEADALVEKIRKDLFGKKIRSGDEAHFRVVGSVLCDLRLQGWSFRIVNQTIEINRAETCLEPSLERKRIRRMHAVNKNVQLLRPSVREFIRGMERKRLGPNGWTSVFSLMRDGRELSNKLQQAINFSHNHSNQLRLSEVIKPYIQIAQVGYYCEYTGIPLVEIWRYFRHTWASEYQTVPGRNVMILIRDSAAANHPVIGIAALASPVVHLTLRDDWIGWSPQKFVNELRANPTHSWAKWALESLHELITGIYVKDLIEAGLITPQNIKRPTEDVIATLEEEGDRARKQHHLHPTKSVHKTPSKNTDDIEWRKRAETHLFRSKRCRALAELLRARLRLKDSEFREATKSGLELALSTSEGRQAIETIRKHVKAIHIGNDVLDISVCGSVAPYSDILGGKLVALMLTSPEIVRHYTQKYGNTNSIIASSMAGRRVSRRPRLTTLTTTSLYGAELNQYTRLRFPATELEGDHGHREIRFQKLGMTQGQGSFHFSAATVDSIEILLSQLSDNRTVNSIFGEGVSPRLRKIRSGLDECGFPADIVLTHGSPRVVYGISLTTNQKDYLLGKAKRPQYILPQRSPELTTDVICQYWTRRWLLNRVKRAEILERVEQHTLVTPIEHGARVVLPHIPDETPLLHEPNI